MVRNGDVDPKELEREKSTLLINRHVALFVHAVCLIKCAWRQRQAISGVAVSLAQNKCLDSSMRRLLRVQKRPENRVQNSALLNASLGDTETLGSGRHTRQHWNWAT